MNKNGSTSGSNGTFTNLLAYSSLIIVALLMFVDRLLPIIGIEIGPTGFLGILFNVLRTISNILTLIILGFAAYRYASGSKKWIKILYWIAVLIFVAATVLIWIK